MRAWIRQTCKFCNRELDGYFPYCDCDGWEDAEALRLAKFEEEVKDVDPEQIFATVFDQSYVSRWAEEDKDKTKLGLDVISYPDGYGCTFYFPWYNEEKGNWDSCGLCWDFAYEDIPTIERLLLEAKAAVEEDKEKKNED